jgi:tetratricopeptide (TPR) repeat protein
MIWPLAIMFLVQTPDVVLRKATSQPPTLRESGVPRLESAREQLGHATRSKRALRGARGVRREEARASAVEAYRAVRVYFPDEHALGAEGAFRAAELLRSGGQERPALAEFRQAWLLGRDTRIGARAGLEMGHLDRRGMRLNDALSDYAAVEALGSDFAEERDLAAYWTGRVHSRLGRAADARRCFERAARRGVDPLQRVRAFEAWIQVLIDERQLEGAAGVLALCRDSLREAARERSGLGVRVRAALEGMRSPGRLAKEVERRRRKEAERGPVFSRDRTWNRQSAPDRSPHLGLSSTRPRST